MMSTEDLEAFLDVMDEAAEITRQRIPRRWCVVVHDGEPDTVRVIAEAAAAGAMLFFAAELGRDHVFSRAELAEEIPELLEAWEGTERRYFNLRMGAVPGEPSAVDVVVDSSLPGLVTSLLELRGGGKARTREELLADPRLALALARWEVLDDALMVEHNADWAGSAVHFVADRRAKVRWGMLGKGGTT
jgi:hypothetical protein